MMSRIRRLRLSEWLCSGILLLMGIHLLVFPATFYRPATSGLGHITSYGAWTTLLIVSGAGRMIALWINGHWPQGTPQIRGIGAMIGAAVFGVMVGGFYSATVNDAAPTMAVGVFFLLMVSDIVSSGFAASDFIRARRALKGG